MLRHPRVLVGAGQYTRGPRVTRAGQYTRGPRVTRAGQYTRGPRVTRAGQYMRGPRVTRAGQYTRGPRVTRAGQYTRGPRVTRAGQYTRWLHYWARRVDAAWGPRIAWKCHQGGCLTLLPLTVSKRVRGINVCVGV